MAWLTENARCAWAYVSIGKTRDVGGTYKLKKVKSMDIREDTMMKVGKEESLPSKCDLYR